MARDPTRPLRNLTVGEAALISDHQFAVGMSLCGMIEQLIQRSRLPRPEPGFQRLLARLY